MKKLTAILTAVLMMILSVTACAETTAEDLWAQLSGQMFIFSSGAGAWDTELIIEEDGSFTGSFHDSEMGETGEGYPNGTVYGCLFHGRLSDPAPVDEYTWTAKLSVEQDEGQVPESIEDGIRYVTAVPYGLEKGQAVRIFLPGTPVSTLPEGFIPWSHLQQIDPDADTIPYYAIWNEADEAGFISDIISEMVEGPMVGGWIPAADPAVTEEMNALFEKGISGLLGVKYTPVAYLGSQVVAGTNHAFLCHATVVYPNAQPEYVIVYLYEDLQGNVSVLNIADFDIGSLCTYGAEAADAEQTMDAAQLTAAPDESEISFYFSGEWLEKGNQFTTLTATKRISEGWDVEILSPMSHGAWVIRATVSYDPDTQSFVYSDGVKYDLIPGEATQEQEAASGLCGTLNLSESDGQLLLTWYDAQNTEDETVPFERAPALPAYMYTGDDPVERAVANYLAADERAKSYLTERGYVTIPCAIIHEVEMTDASNAKVYGSFWILNYVKRGQTLYNISGGEYPAVILLEKVNDQWQVVSMEEAGDGTDYDKDIARFANGNKELENKYYAAANLGAPENQAIRTRFIKAYVDAYGLNITEYQDYGWEPIPLQ